jgi:hypothetical protein
VRESIRRQPLGDLWHEARPCLPHYRTWAVSAAAGLFWRNNPEGQQYLARLVNTHGKGQALTVLAQKLARAVYDMVQRDTAFALDQFCNEDRRGVREPAASRAAEGISLAMEGWCR